MLRCSDPREFLNVFQQGNPVFEIRILHVPGQRGRFAGHFTSVDDAADAIAKFDGQFEPEAFYCSLNTFETGKKKRAKSKRTGLPYEVELIADNTIRPKGEGECINKEDMIYRRWLFVDIDPIRKTGTNSSDIQNNAAIAMAEKIRDDMVASGWPMPILGMSGNGACLLWRVYFKDSEFPNLISGCVYALAEKYTPNAKEQKDALDHSVLALEKSDEEEYRDAKKYDDEENAASTHVDVDKSVHEPSRICKVFGTMTRKDKHTDLRPRRQSWFELPHSIEVVPIDKLKELAGTRAVKSKRKSSSTTMIIPDGDRSSSWETLPADDPIMKEEIDTVLKKWSRVPLDVQRSISNDYVLWRAAGCCLHFTHDSLYSRWIELSKLSSKFDENVCRDQWNGFVRPSPDESGNFPDNVITDRWINKYLPNDYNANKEIRDLLALTLDIDNKIVQERLWKNFQMWNKSQECPHSESDLMIMFSVQLRQRIFAMSQKGHKTGIEAIESSQVDVVSPDGATVDADDVAKILEGKETLTESDKEKVFKSNQKAARLMPDRQLNDKQLQTVAEWSLYFYDEMPVVYELEVPSAFSHGRARVKLSPDELASFAQTDRKLIGAKSMLPSELAKPWRAVVAHLMANMIEMSGRLVRDHLSTIASSIIDICLSSKTDLSRMTKRSSGVNTSGMNRGEVIFHELDKSTGQVIAFWFNAKTMFNEILSHQISLKLAKVSSTDYSTALDKFGVSLRKNIPRELSGKRLKLAYIDQACFSRMCDIAGEEDKSMVLYKDIDAPKPSSKFNQDESIYIPKPRLIQKHEDYPANWDL
jgi:hypothetical protein